MLATWLHHTQCLTDPVGVTVNPAEQEQMQRFQNRVTSPPTPWHPYHPSRKIDTNADSDHELEREMDFLGIPEVHQDQFASPGSVSPGLKGLNPWGESSENEARRGGKLSSALGIDLSGEIDGTRSVSSAVATGVQTFHGTDLGTGRHQSRAEEAFGSLRRRHPEGDHVDDSGRWESLNNSSQYTIIPVARTQVAPVTPAAPAKATGSHVELSQEPEEQEYGPVSTALSSPDLTESVLVDITSYAPSAFSVSSASDHGSCAIPASAPLSSFSTRAHSPAFSSSSYDVLSSPPAITSMANSPHSMSASISLESYPAFDEYDSRHPRYHARHLGSRNRSYTPSDSGWTDGGLGSDA